MCNVYNGSEGGDSEMKKRVYNDPILEVIILEIEGNICNDSSRLDTEQDASDEGFWGDNSY